MTELVDVLVVSEEAGAKKPEPEIFRVALERCRSDRKRNGDVGRLVGTQDVMGAHAAGIRAVWLNRRGLRSPAPHVGAEIESLVPTDPVVDLLLQAKVAHAFQPDVRPRLGGDVHARGLQLFAGSARELGCLCERRRKCRAPAVLSTGAGVNAGDGDVTGTGGTDRWEAVADAKRRRRKRGGAPMVRAAMRGDREDPIPKATSTRRRSAYRWCTSPNPPSSGTHSGSGRVYKTYTKPFLPGFWVHNLEHGAMVITYNCPGGCAAELAEAQAFIDSLPTDCPAAVNAQKRRIIMLPDPELDVRFAASAWNAGPQGAVDAWASL